MLHRGRIQAQGEDLEESESWSQNEPPTKEDGLQMLENLKNKIPKKEAKLRKEAFEKAENFIIQAGENGGLNAVVQKTFMVRDSEEARVDTVRRCDRGKKRKSIYLKIM
nr:hypothetical protein [Thermoflexibacter sp.]